MCASTSGGTSPDTGSPCFKRSRTTVEDTSGVGASSRKIDVPCAPGASRFALRMRAASDDDEVRLLEDLRIALPRCDLREGIGARDEEDLRWRDAARVHPVQRLRGVGHALRL